MRRSTLSALWRAAPICFAAVVALWAPPARAADRLVDDAVWVAPSFEASPVSAFGGALAWYRAGREDREGHVFEFRLVVHRDGVTRVAPAPAAGELALDLGPGRGGGPVAVYPRCPASRCDLVEHALRAGTTRRLGAISSTRASEEAGASWRGRYLFSRLGRRSPGIFSFRPLRRVAPRGTRQLDLRGDVAAYRERDRREERIVVRRAPGLPACTLARIRRLARGEGVLDVPRRGHGEVWNPVLDGDHVHWLDYRSDGREARITVRRRRVPSARCRSRGGVEVGRRLSASFMAVDAGRVFYTNEDGVFEATDPRPWGR